MTLGVILILLTTHFVGDFILQNDWMALNKSKSWLALGCHVYVYTFVLAAAAATIHEGAFPNFWWFVGINGLVHYVQDAVTSRVNAKLWTANQRHWFFVSVGFDQLLHYIVLFHTAWWWL